MGEGGGGEGGIGHGGIGLEEIREPYYSLVEPGQGACSRLNNCQMKKSLVRLKIILTTESK